MRENETKGAKPSEGNKSESVLVMFLLDELGKVLTQTVVQKAQSQRKNRS